MRILFLCGEWSATKEPPRLVGVHPELRDGRHRWVRAVDRVIAGAGDIPYDLRRDTMRDIVHRFSGGGPDVVVVWAPGYQPLPMGIEEVPCPVVACYSDWIFLNPSQAGTLDLYDAIFTCRGGVRILQRMGYSNVEYWPMYGHDPVISRVIPGIEKVWDIGMVGNLNSRVQRERAAWLARVARLSGRYRVRIAEGLFNEEYARFMNATRITFNRTLTGAMNMRCYEAAACGSLLFCEEENEEIRDFFEDRVHCVLYNERNLEELFEYYLSHDEERQGITDAAVERVAEFSFPRSLNRLADRLEELGLGCSGRPVGRMALAAPELKKRHARQMTPSGGRDTHVVAASLLQEALIANPEDTAARNDLAVVLSIGVRESDDPALQRELTTRSLSEMRRVVSEAPGSASYTLNLASMLADAGWPEAAQELAQQALALLDSGTDDPADPLCLPFPCGWDDFRVQDSLLYNATLTSPESFALLRRCLLLNRGGMLLGERAEEQGLTDLAALGYRVAIAGRPDLGLARVRLARILERQGAVDEALSQLEACFETDPLLPTGWVLYAELLLRQGRDEAARAFVTDRLAILEAVRPAQEQPDPPTAHAELVALRATLLRLVEPRVLEPAYEVGAGYGRP